MSLSRVSIFLGLEFFQVDQVNPHSQTLFGNALGFRNSVSRREATELPRHWHSQTEFGNEESWLWRTLGLSSCHSARRAMMGSTRVARRAGNQAAMNATAETR